MKFELRLPGETYFGPGEVARIGTLAAGLGKRALVVTGWGSLEGSGRFAGLLRNLDAHGVSVERFRAEREPGVEEVNAAALLMRMSKCEMVIAAGGGSSIDLGKAAAAMAPNTGSVKDYLEDVGKGAIITRAPLPVIAIPTTAGTGSEATRNAVIGTAKEGFKRSLRDSRLIPRLAIIDPELTVSCPPNVTAGSGMDALTQLLEALTSRNSTPPMAALALSGIAAVGRGLPRAVRDGNDLDARCEMSYAAFLSGVTLSHCGLGAVHSLASPLGGLFGVPHTIACALLLPLVTTANIAAIEEGRGVRHSLDSYRLAADALGADVPTFCAGFSFPRLGSYGVTDADISKIIAGAGTGSLQSNPAELTRVELSNILAGAL